jgi:hypothetical protein
MKWLRQEGPNRTGTEYANVSLGRIMIRVVQHDCFFKQARSSS